MTSAQRFLAALRHQVPDRVPVAPDISNYIPARRTGLPFWEIYFQDRVELWRAYLDAADYFGIDAWISSCWGYGAQYQHDDAVEYRHEHELITDGMVRRTRIHTPAGELTSEEVCFRGDPPSFTQKPIKDLSRDFAKYRWCLRPPVGLNQAHWDEVRQECARRQHAFGVGVSYPGFQHWFSAIQGGVEALTYAFMDTPPILDEWLELDLAAGTRGMELILAGRPDYVLFGGSGTITLASPELARRYALPALKKWSRMCRDAGVPTLLHSCGKSRVLVDMLAEETDVDGINPLEIPPMGDIDLAEVKRVHGQRMTLMGNLHTTDVMLRGTPALVQQRAREAMRDAGAGGGFILSTGDQCGPGTPDANLFALTEAAHEYGVYSSRGLLTQNTRIA